MDEDHIDTVRGQFPRTGRQPKCILKDMQVTKALRYTFVKGRDTHKGVLHIHGMPAHSREIMDWLCALDLGIPYRGEGLPGVSYKVLLALIRRSRVRTHLEGQQRHELLEAANYKRALCG